MFDAESNETDDDEKIEFIVTAPRLKVCSSGLISLNSLIACEILCEMELLQNYCVIAIGES